MLINEYHLIDCSCIGKRINSVSPFITFKEEINDQIIDLFNLLNYPELPRLPIYYMDDSGILKEYPYKEAYPYENTYLYNRWKNVYLQKLDELNDSMLKEQGLEIDLDTIKKVVYEIVSAANANTAGVYVEGINPLYM